MKKPKVEYKKYSRKSTSGKENGNEIETHHAVELHTKYIRFASGQHIFSLFSYCFLL